MAGACSTDLRGRVLVALGGAGARQQPRAGSSRGKSTAHRRAAAAGGRRAVKAMRAGPKATIRDGAEAAMLGLDPFQAVWNRIVIGIGSAQRDP
jgi:hypothetical protein